jgi:hypothetical protein
MTEWTLMQNYKNLGGNSNVTRFEIAPESITVEFGDGSQYLYSYRAPGSELVEQMKSLALQGRGLNSFISRVVKGHYEKKIR